MITKPREAMVSTIFGRSSEHDYPKGWITIGVHGLKQTVTVCGVECARAMLGEMFSAEVRS